MHTADIISQLKTKADPKYLAGMQRFGIDSTKAIGVPLPELRKVAKSIKKNHSLALG